MTPPRFWGDAAQTVDWSNPWDRVLSFDESGAAIWFRGATTNTCWNALDRHLASGRGNQLALIYDSPVSQTQQFYTYQELTQLVARAAGMLQSLGVTSGDRVMIYMPAITEAVISMLACARIGAIHSVVFGGFAAGELAARIRDCRPRVMLAASCGIEINRIVLYKSTVDAACDATRGIVEACVIVQRPQMPGTICKNHDYVWHELIAAAMPSPCVRVPATDPLYIIHTSGTTGRPKEIVRPQGGHLMALAWSMRAFYDTKPGEVFGPRPTSGGKWVILIWHTVRSSTGARLSCMRASRWERRTRALSGASWTIMALRLFSPRLRRYVQSGAKILKDDSCALIRSQSFAHCFWPVNDAICQRLNGSNESSSDPWWIMVANRIRLAHRRKPAWYSALSHQAWNGHAADARLGCAGVR
jgi:hypothetical protein